MESDPSDAGVKDKSGKTAWSKARATILWILAEFCSKNLKAYTMAPDVLRKFAKSFPQESDLVKLQILNLTAKSIVSLTSRNLFAKSLEPYSRSFFVKTKDPVHVKLFIRKQSSHSESFKRVHEIGSK